MVFLFLDTVCRLIIPNVIFAFLTALTRCLKASSVSYVTDCKPSPFILYSQYALLCPIWSILHLFTLKSFANLLAIDISVYILLKNINILCCWNRSVNLTIICKLLDVTARYYCINVINKKYWLIRYYCLTDLLLHVL